MTWFTENPWPLVLGCLALALVLAFGWYQTRQRPWAWSLLAPLLLALLALGIDQLVETDREAVITTLEAARAAVAANDLEGLLAHVAADAEPVRNQLSAILSRLTITRASIGDLQVTTRGSGAQKGATATFLGSAQFRDRANQSPYESAARRFTLQLRYRDGRWMFSEMQMREPFGPGAAALE